MVAFFGLIIWGVATLVYRMGKVPVTVKYAPFNAVVKVDGRRISNNATEYLVAGEYSVVVETEHFKTIEETVTVSKDYPYLIGLMEPSTDMGRQISIERQKDFLEVEGIYGRLAADDGAKEKEEYPILKYIPINNALFSISYAYNDDNSLQINIKASQTYRDTTVAKLYSFSGVVPTDYNVVFKDFKNPFDGTFVENDASDPLDFIKTGYKTTIGSNYLVKTGRIEGDYYYTTIQTQAGQQDGYYASWRVLLEKSDGKWKFVTTPYPILTKYNAKNVSTELLDKVNRL